MKTKATDLKAYTLDEVAEILKVKRRNLYAYIKAGKLPAIKIGREWRVTEEALREVLKSGI